MPINQANELQRDAPMSVFANLRPDPGEPSLWHLVAIDLRLKRYYVVESDLTSAAFIAAWQDWQQAGDNDVFLVPWPARTDLPESLSTA